MWVETDRKTERNAKVCQARIAMNRGHIVTRCVCVGGNRQKEREKRLVDLVPLLFLAAVVFLFLLFAGIVLRVSTLIFCAAVLLYLSLIHI